MGAKQSKTCNSDKLLEQQVEDEQNVVKVNECNPQEEEHQQSLESKKKLQESQEEQPEQDHEVKTTETSIRRPSIVQRKNQWEPSEVERKNLSIKDFEIKGILGFGTYGIVKLALHLATGTSVALKMVSKEQVVSMRQEKHILRERQVHSHLNHPLIASLICTFQDQDCVYLVMEFLPGGELWSVVYSNHISRETDDDDDPHTNSNQQQQEEEEDSECTTLNATSRHRVLRKNGEEEIGGGLQEAHAAFYLGCILTALEYLHDQNILYRDLKLENLVIDAKGYPQLLDFGFAKMSHDTQKNLTLCGSMEYMAPEILLHQPHDQRADLWSFGVICYELFYGKTPFYHENPREQGRRITNDPVELPTNDTINPMVCDLIQKLLEKNPDKRFLSIKQVKEHGFFQKYFQTFKKWEELAMKQTKAPFVPLLDGPFDTSFFEENSNDEVDNIEPYLGDDVTMTDGLDLFHEF